MKTLKIVALVLILGTIFSGIACAKDPEPSDYHLVYTHISDEDFALIKANYESKTWSEEEVYNFVKDKYTLIHQSGLSLKEVNSIIDTELRIDEYNETSRSKLKKSNYKKITEKLPIEWCVSSTTLINFNNVKSIKYQVIMFYWRDATYSLEQLEGK
ncbi:hypothetical protein AGMMS50230_04070 [Spirochaetia bacterium]|nr:hypothetical protein AGMMS50230_04070 [Spirochaetia bacterium]